MGIISFSEGSELAGGRYRLDRRLGTGGMATVWLALDTRLARSVAIKLPSEALTADETFSIRFEREAQTAAALSHPHLVPVFDYGTEGERPYLVSEFIDGSDLRQLRERNRPPVTEVLAKTLLEALAHIHGAGIVHRDIKPGNVLVDRTGRILLTDFGIAQSGEETSLTKTGHVVGTLSYLAPEVYRGGRAGPRADLYALGVLLHEQLDADDPDRVVRLAEALKQDDPEARPRNAERALEMLERRPVVIADTNQIPAATATARRNREEPTAARPFPTSPADRVGVGSGSGSGSTGSRMTWIGAGLGVLIVAIVVGVAIAAGGGDDGSGGDGGGGSTPPTSTQASTEQTTTEETTEPTTTTAEETTATTEITDVAAYSSERGIALNNAGFALLQDGDPAAALPKLEKSVASFPPDSVETDHAFALFNYAQALRLTGNPEAAIPLLEKRLAISDFRVSDVEAEIAAAQEAAGLAAEGG